MRFVTKTAIAALLATAGTQAFAFNSFVIEVPYEISLPENYTSVHLICSMANANVGQTSSRLEKTEDGTIQIEMVSPPFDATFETDVTLASGAAGGSLSFGYGDTGNAPTVRFSQQQTDTLKQIIALGDFRLSVECRAVTATANAEEFTMRDDGAAIYSRGQPVTFLDNDSVVSFFAEVRNGDNIANSTPSSGTLQRPSGAAQAPAGLSAILGGD